MAVVTRSMLCPVCGAGTRVPKTHPVQDGEVIRERECFGPLKHRFMTREVFLRDIVKRGTVTAARRQAALEKQAAKDRGYAPMNPKQRAALFEQIAVNVATHIVKQGSTT
jgi:transcriptional regulator NrdR family protein